MKNRLRTGFAAALVLLAPCVARADDKDDVAPTIPPPQAATNIPISQEFDIEGAYASGTEFKQGSARIGAADNTYGHFNYVVSPQIEDGVLLRFGIDAERNSFGLPARAPLPNTLQSVDAEIGADFAPTEQILIRAEVSSGHLQRFRQRHRQRL